MRAKRTVSAAAFLLLVLAPALSAQEGSFLEIRVGETVEGRLVAGGPALQEYGSFAVYRFQSETGNRYVADARSAEFDTYLILAHLTGGITEFLREDDDGGEGTDARLAFTLDRDGDYLLIVRGWQEGEQGRFTLSLEERDLPPAPEPRPVRPGDSLEGRLTEESGVFLTDWDEEISYDLWTLEGRGGEHYLISLESDDFDAYLDFGPMSGGEVVVTDSDDDGGEGRNALLRVRLPHDGLFGIRARAISQTSEYGAYRLRVEPYTPPPPTRRPLEVGETVTGELSPTEDAALEGGIFYHEWVFQGQAGERVRLRMRSDDFDTYLVLGRQGADGTFHELASNDDAPDDGLNSLIEIQLPTDGEYVIRARSFGSGASGAYTLEVLREP